MKEWIKNLRASYRSTLKSTDTEEWFDLVFYRPIGYVWALIARFLHIHPNVITIASIFIGIGAGVLIWPDNIWLNICGCLLLVLANSFDSADGQLARLTGQYSRLGRILDGFSSDLWFVAIYAAICFREISTSPFFIEHKWMIWAMAALAGACHGVQAAMADYYRQFHLYFLKGGEGSELDTSVGIWKKWHSLTWRHDFWNKLAMIFYASYTSSQQRRTPRMQELRRSLLHCYGSPLGDAAFRARFRALSLPLMKYTNILSFNTRCFALFAAVLILRMPWLYFAFELTVLNGVLVYMMWRHEKICKELRPICE